MELSKVSLYCILHLFQFQLGTIGTFVNQSIIMPFGISIPVRYDWNMIQNFILFVTFQFQFQLGTIGTDGSQLLYSEFFKFQFQLGTIGTRNILPKPLLIRISIPVRYDWNLIGAAATMAAGIFQFQLGTIGTMCHISSRL